MVRASRLRGVREFCRERKDKNLATTDRSNCGVAGASGDDRAGTVGDAAGMSEPFAATGVQADRDRSVLAWLINTMTDITFDAQDYDGVEIEDDLVRLGVLVEASLDSERHTDHTEELEPGDRYFEFTEYGRGLIGRANDDRRKGLVP